MLTKRPRGTNDILPDTSDKWQWIEQEARELCEQFGYKEIRTPIFEHTELFQRGVGETTDIVQKEMYTFLDRGQRSITLRPESTASVVRAYLENKLYNGPQPTKLFYIGPMFRYDRPQSGRYRQFHQFGIEVLGSAHPAIDAEVVYAAMQFYKRLGVQNTTLHINSVGCPQCRPVHKRSVTEYLEPFFEELCSTCQSRYEKNPLRIMDCKNDKCQELAKDAPTVTQNLCGECETHFGRVLDYLNVVEVKYEIDEHLVRGLDYYTGTAFEITAEELGAQNTICGGGRYDFLVRECGGQDTPGIGFALGLERVLLTLENQGVEPRASKMPVVFIAGLGEETQKHVFNLAQRIRRSGLTAEMDFMDRSLKAQMKFSNKLNAAFTVIIGEEEIESGKVTVKNMMTAEQSLINMDDLENYLARQVERGQ